MKHRIDRTIHINVVADVVLDKGETLISHQVGDVVCASRNKIIQRHNVVAFFQETV